MRWPRPRPPSLWPKPGSDPKWPPRAKASHPDKDKLKAKVKVNHPAKARDEPRAKDRPARREPGTTETGTVPAGLLARAPAVRVQAPSADFLTAIALPSSNPNLKNILKSLDRWWNST